MRRKDREVKNLDGIKAIVSQCKVCRIALSDNEGLYIVPVNFGYKFDGEKLIIYIHSAKDGRKVTAMTSGCSVAVEMDCGHALVENTVPCKHGYRFSSVIGNGKASLVTDANEKINALKLLMKHQTGKDFDFGTAEAESVAVFKITLSSYSGKIHE